MQIKNMRGPRTDTWSTHKFMLREGEVETLVVTHRDCPADFVEFYLLAHLFFKTIRILSSLFL